MLRWKEIGLFGVAVVATLIILGAVMWSKGQYDENVGCDLQRSVDRQLNVFTEAEIDARYQSCLANASAKIRWSMPVTITGAVLAGVGMIGTAAYFGLSRGKPPTNLSYSGRKFTGTSFSANRTSRTR